MLLCLVALAGPAADRAQAGDRFITLASTTSTENSGLFAHLLPIFRSAHSIDVRVIAVGTGQAIRLARNGDIDVVLVHHRESEEKLVADGIGVMRRPVMYNDFILVGPASDPAKIKGMRSAVDALRRIALTKALFVSRGDDSGTHKAELKLWRAAKIDPRRITGTWYRELGAGMGATLNTGVAMGAHTLVDRATWTSFANRQKTVLLVEGDARLFNQYAVIRVNPARHPHVKEAGSKAFVNWLISSDGQAAISQFRLNSIQLFNPNATP